MIKVEYVDHMGNDLRVVDAARVCVGVPTGENDMREGFGVNERDMKLIHYLAEHRHTTPFEHCVLSVIVHCPIFIKAQIHRHRTFSYNEVSRRYTSENIDTWSPDDWRQQATSNRQSSEGILSSMTANFASELYHEAINQVIETYHTLLEQGVAREQARAVLPQALVTSFYMTGNLLNWMKFINLRIAPDAQIEVRDVAQQCLEHVEQYFPISAKALLQNDNR